MEPLSNEQAKETTSPSEQGTPETPVQETAALEQPAAPVETSAGGAEDSSINGHLAADLSAEEAEEGARLMAASMEEVKRPVDYQVGDIIRARIVSIDQNKQNVFLDVGDKSEAIMMFDDIAKEGEPEPQVGDEVEAYVLRASDAGLELGKQLTAKDDVLLLFEEAFENGLPLEGTVKGKNKGGLDVQVHGKRAFCPVSQIELRYCENPAQYIGQTLTFRILELKDGGKNVVLSRRAILEEEAAAVREALVEKLVPGAELEGTVRSLEAFGAFVEIGPGVDGLLHVSEISHTRVNNPAEVLDKGQQVRVVVKSYEPGRNRLSLSMKALERDPWEIAIEDLKEGAVVEGKVVRLQPFGAFVEIGPGVDGLIHVSELAFRRIKHPQDILSLGDSIQTKIINIDRGRKRIGLSLKQMEAAPGTASDSKLNEGEIVKALVDRVEGFGVFVKLEDNVRALLPNNEALAPRGADMSKEYPEGKELDVLVISLDRRNNRVRVSEKEAVKQRERAEYQEFMSENQPTESLGSMADLFKNIKL